MIAHTGWTHTWTTILKCSENGTHGASPGRKLALVKPKRGVGRPTEPDLGPTVQKSSDPTGPTKPLSGFVVEKGWDHHDDVGPQL